MRVMNRFFPGVLVCAVALIPASAAFAQDEPPEPPQPPSVGEVVEACVGHMVETTLRTTGAIGQATENGVETIARLATNGAGPRMIIHAGDHAKGNCAHIARHGQRALNSQLRRCVRALRQLEAPPEAFEFVLEARRRAGLAIGEALTECKRRINRAVRRALDSLDDEPAPQPLAAALLQ